MKSETDAAGSKEADAGNRHWYKIATGVEITAGTEQAGTQREKPVSYTHLTLPTILRV